MKAKLVTRNLRYRNRWKWGSTKCHRRKIVQLARFIFTKQAARVDVQ